jgi:hypothetical protein
MKKVLYKATELGCGSPITLERKLRRLQQMPGASRLLTRLASASDKEQFQDYLAELRYALIFAGLQFQVEIEPLGSKGPDLQISRDGHQSVVEVTRFREIYPGPPLVDPDSHDFLLVKYGNVERDTRKFLEKIIGKFTQVKDQDAIIALWNDEEELEGQEATEAMPGLFNGVVSIPQGISFVLYAGGWETIRDRQEFRCFPLTSNQKPHHKAWQRELIRSTVRELIERALAQTTNTG